MATAREWSEEVLLSVVLLISIAANGLALVVFIARPNLRTISNRFVINLLAGNLACAGVLGPLVLADASGVAVPCFLAEAAGVLFALAAVLGVLLIAADQFLAVTDPLRYHARLGHARSLVLITAQWVTVAVFTLLIALAPRSANSPWKHCQHAGESQTFDFYRIIFSCLYILVVSLALIAICLMYAKISLAAHRSAKPPGPPPALISLKIERLQNDVKSGEECVGLLMNCDKKPSESAEAVVTNSPPYQPMLSRSLRSVLLDASKPYPSPLCLKLTHETEKKGLSHDDIYKITQSTPPATGLKTVRSSPNFGSSDCHVAPVAPRCASSYMSSLRCRISNASLFRYREESRAARISALVVVLSLATQLPAALMLAVPSLGTFPLMALCLGGAVSPFLFAYRSRRIKSELCRMCCRRTGSEDVYPHPATLRRASSLSTERSWRPSRNSSQAALRLLRALAAEGETKKSNPVLLGCPPGKSILKRVRAQSRRWGRRPQRCKFSQEAETHSRRLDKGPRRSSLDSVPRGSISSAPRSSLSSAASSRLSSSDAR